MIVAILFAYFGYKKANESGRNGILWAVIAVLSFLLSQFLVGLVIGIVFLIGSESFGWSPNLISENDILVNVAGIVAGLGGGFLVLWYLDRPVRERTPADEPPPPPEFNE